TAANDHIMGGGGNDYIGAPVTDAGWIFGQQRPGFPADGGNDILDGGAGSDVIEAGSGNDILIGGTGSDVLHAGAGHDRIYGESRMSVAEAILRGNTDADIAARGGSRAGVRRVAVACQRGSAG
ncbi:calcium-binding protein, partial [Sedimenticola sp.]|uniref:calcium-binding protein n=1 Tax=Sedimenticola sp. TaxID=1940285 RepID=UPI003D0A7F51